MGFDVSTTGDILTFPEDSKYAGLEVTLDEAPMGLLLDITEDYARLSGGDLDVKTAAKVLKGLVENLAEVLEDWNVTRKGVPVPPTLEGVRSMGKTFVLTVIGAWLTGNVSADEELGKGSGSGGSSEAALAAMAASSSALPSSSQQRL